MIELHVHVYPKYAALYGVPLNVALGSHPYFPEFGVCVLTRWLIRTAGLWSLLVTCSSAVRVLWRLVTCVLYLFAGSRAVHFCGHS